MTRLIVFLLYFAAGACLTSCAIQWFPDERSGLGKFDADDFVKFGTVSTRNIFEKTISVPINRNDPSTKYLDLYYFVRMPHSRAAKSVLFVPGGPGQFTPGPMVFLTLADFLINNGYNVVFYHARGAGFSQVPPSNEYDRFLKTSYVIDDIEAIRKDFLGPQSKWDAVIGYSFGTVVAQRYASAYRNNVDRLILIGTQSRHGFQNLPGAFDQITEEIRNINRTTLAQILQRSEFNNLTTREKNLIVDAAFGSNSGQGIFQKAEEKFGGLGFVISAYCYLKAQNELARYNLEYSRQFFKALRGLRDVGWFPPFPLQVDYGKSISDEILGNASGVADCGPDVTGSSDRVFYVVNIYDGINMRFLKRWLDNGKTNVRDAVRASGGEAHYDRGVNKFLNKVGISESDFIENWDPARYNQYDKPTMILKGSADTVPAGGAAEHIFLNALAGSRTLIEYPGVGHLYRTPSLPSNFQSTLPGNKPACLPTQPPQPLRDCLIYSFLEMTPDTFNDPTVNRILALIINDGAGVCYRDQSMTQTRSVAGTCP